MEIALVVLFVIVLVVGLAIIPFGLPGTVLIAADAAAYGYFTHWHRLSLTAVAVMIGLAILSEVVDNLLGVAGAKKHGSSKWGMLGAFVGSIAGAIVGVPIPLVGSVVGAFLGMFLGAFAVEYYLQRDTLRAARAGWGAFLGKVAATVFKLALGMALVVWCLFRVF